MKYIYVYHEYSLNTFYEMIVCISSLDSQSNKITINGSGIMMDFSETNQPWNLFSILIKKIIIEEGIISIKSDTFYDLPNMMMIKLSNTLETIETYGISKCAFLEYVFHHSETSIDSTVLNEFPKVEKIYGNVS